MSRKAEPWEVAARLEEAAIAIREASKALDAACSAILSTDDTLEAFNAIKGTEHVHTDMAKALQDLSDKYQAIADAEVEP